MFTVSGSLVAGTEAWVPSYWRLFKDCRLVCSCTLVAREGGVLWGGGRSPPSQAWLGLTIHTHFTPSVSRPSPKRWRPHRRCYWQWYRAASCWDVWECWCLECWAQNVVWPPLVFVQCCTTVQSVYTPRQHSQLITALALLYYITDQPGPHYTGTAGAEISQVTQGRAHNTVT